MQTTNTLLAYNITANQFPLQASAPSGNPNVVQLTVVATNNTSNDVPLQGIMIQIPIGQGATQLTNDSDDIGPVPPANWNKPQIQTPDGFIQYYFLPQEGYGTLSADQSLNFIFNNIQVNSQTGAVEIDVTEGSNNCLPPNCPVAQLSITKFPNSWGQVSFWADHLNIPAGGSDTLHWSGPSGATYTIEYYDSQQGTIVNVPAQGQPPLSNQGQYPSQGAPLLTLQQTTVFTLSVDDTINGPTYHAQTQITVAVQVPPPVINSFTAVPAAVNIGQVPAIQLTWTAANVSMFEIAGVGSFQGAQAANGSSPIAPVATTRYFADAYGNSGYSGPPVTAGTWIKFIGSVVSDYLDVWGQSQSGTMWTVSVDSGRQVFSVNLSVEDNPSGKYRVVSLGLQPGVQIAYLGTIGANADYNSVVTAQYGTAFNTPMPYTNGEMFIGVGEYDSEQTLNVGSTWGLKFSDGRFGVIWYQNALSDGGGPNYSKWSFTFNWILFPAQ